MRGSRGRFIVRTVQRGLSAGLAWACAYPGTARTGVGLPVRRGHRQGRRYSLYTVYPVQQTWQLLGPCQSGPEEGKAVGRVLAREEAAPCRMNLRKEEPDGVGPLPQRTQAGDTEQGWAMV